MIVLIHSDGDFARKNPLSALGFKSTTHQIAASLQDISCRDLQLSEWSLLQIGSQYSGNVTEVMKTLL